jgi:hypothetical protein
VAAKSENLKAVTFAQGSLWISFGFFLVCYIDSALRSAKDSPLWMDEVLSVWALRLPSASAVCRAILHGSEFAPPTFPLLMHFYSKIVGGTDLELRLPTIGAVLFCGVCCFIVFRRYLGDAPAVFGTCLALESLRPWGLQVRPYALVTACFAAAMLLWDELNWRPAWWRSALIGLLLALATSLHFYAVLFVPCFGLIELIYHSRTRQVRTSLWVSLIAAGASIFLWLPLIHTINQYNAGDTGGAKYYAKPTIFGLSGAYQDLFLGNMASVYMVLAAIVILAAGKLLGETESIDKKQNENQPANFWNLVLGIALLPLIVFLFSAFVTKTFNERYCIAATIAASAVIAGSLRASQAFRRAVPWVISLGALLTFLLGAPGPKDIRVQQALRRLPGTSAIVIADGEQFFPLLEAATPDIRARLLYLIPPSGITVGDLTNQHEIQRWKTIVPGLPVENMTEFLQSNRPFYVLDQQTSDDSPAVYLVREHLIELISQSDGILIYASRPQSEARTASRN